MTITLTREEAQQVLEAFDVATTHFAKDRNEILAAIETLRARLAQPEPAPVAWLYRGDGMVQVLIKRNDHFFSLDEGENFIKGEPLYTAPPHRKEWQGLTDEEIKDILDCGRGGLVDIKKAEAKLKDKNT